MNGKQTVRNHLVVASPVGKLRLVASEKGLVAIDVRSNTAQVETSKNAFAQAILLKTKKQLEQYFAGRRTSFDVASVARSVSYSVWKNNFVRSTSIKHQEAKGLSRSWISQRQKSNSNHRAVSPGCGRRRFARRLFAWTENEKTVTGARGR
jgi:Tfp pilus assembly protein PilE